MDRKYLLQDLADALISAENIKKKNAEDFLRAYFTIIEEGLLKDKIVKINNLGVFKLIEAEARTSVDVNTGKSFLIKEHFKLCYIPDPELRDLINKPFSGFEPVETEEKILLNEFIPQDIPEKEEPIIIPLPQAIIEKKEIDYISETEPQFETENDSTSTSNQLTQSEERISNLNNIFYEISENGVIPDNISDSPELMHKEIKTEIKSGDEKKWKYAFWIFLVLIAALAIFWTIKSNIDAKRDIDEKNKVFDEFLNKSSKSAVKIDSLCVIKQDSIDNEEDTILHTKDVVKTVDDPLYVLIHPAENLMTLAQKYYGNKAFWVYIYLDNKDVINNPNDITVGKRIRIPKTEQAKTNPNDPECIRKAGVLQHQIMSELKSTSSITSTGQDSTQ